MKIKSLNKILYLLLIIFTIAITASCGGGGGSNSSSDSGGGGSTTYTIGGTVSGLSATGLVLQNNGGDDLAITGNGSFTFSTAVNNGSAYAVTVLTQPTGPAQTCNVLRNGSGAVSGANIDNIIIDCTATRFAYAINDQDGTLSIYSIDAASGRLRHNGYMPTGGNNPRAVAVDPTNKFVFVSNHAGSSGIRTYTINASTGALTSSAFLNSDIAYSFAFDPNGKFLFTAGFSGWQNVSAYSINQTTGALTAVAGSPFTAGTSPMGVAVDSTGRFLYATDTWSNNVYAFTIDANSGALTSIGTVAAGDYPHRVAVDLSGRFLFVLNGNSHNISVFSINNSNGSLSEIAGSPFALGIIGSPQSIALSPTGRFGYVADTNGSVVAFTINAGTGALATIAGSPYTAGLAPYAVTIDSTGRFVYAANISSNDISVFSVNSTDGALNAIGKIRARNAPIGIAMANGPTKVTYTPKFAYAANAGGGNVSQYTIGATGALTSMASPTVTAGSQPRSITVDPFGRFVYLANYVSNNISAYTVNQITGELTEVAGSPYAAGTSPTSVRIDPSGRFVYASNYGWPATGSVSAYTINPVSGALTAVAGSPFAAGNGSSSIAIDPSGRFVYTSNLLNDTLTAFLINTTNGVLSRIDADAVTGGIQDLVVTNARPVSITVDPTGQFTYIATACGTAWAFTINATNGALTRIDSDPGGLCGASADAPDSVIAEPLGKYLYLTNYNTADVVSAYEINAVSGALTAVTGSPFSAGSGARSVSIDLSGKYAYTANSSSSSNNISQYTIGTDGSLATMTAPTVAAGSNPLSITTTGTIQ